MHVWLTCGPSKGKNDILIVLTLLYGGKQKYSYYSIQTTSSHILNCLLGFRFVHDVLTLVLCPHWQKMASICGKVVYQVFNFRA